MARIALVALTVLLFFVSAGGRPPAANEAHYLSRARHFWNPEWCRRDLFLASSEAHPLFQTTFGAAARSGPLPAVAWLGRGLGWTVLAMGWVSLTGAVLGPGHGWSLLAAALALVGWNYGHMSGEWVVGGIEAKVPAYAAVFFALGAAAAGRWRWAGLGFSLAVAFHVLVGGWSLVAASPLAVRDLRKAWRERRAGAPATQTHGHDDFGDRSRQAARWALCIACCAVLIGVGLVPALRLDAGIDRSTLLAARKVYVFHRIDHHLLWHRFPPHFIARHLALIGLWAALWRWGRPTRALDRLQWIVGGAVLIALTGAILERVTAPQAWLCASTMRYYWYRLSDALLPVGVSCLLVHSLAVRGPRRAIWAEGLLAALLLSAAAAISVEWFDRMQDPRPAADQQGRARPRQRLERRAAFEEYSAWREVCDWCGRWTPADSLFLTPWNIQTFKWYAGRAEFGTWKDVPQQSQALVEWNQRRREIHAWGLYRGQAPGEIPAFVRWLNARDIHYVLVPGTIALRHESLPIVFQNRHFRVYRVTWLASSMESSGTTRMVGGQP